ERVAREARLPRIRFHDLRHTHATLLLKAGVPLKVLSERLGHSTPAFTMTVYQHVLPGCSATRRTCSPVSSRPPTTSHSVGSGPVAPSGRDEAPPIMLSTRASWWRGQDLNLATFGL